MSAGISAIGWLALGTVAATTAYSADQQRKGIHAQMDAMKASQEADARQTIEAQTSASVAANAKLADAKARRRSSALGLGDTSATGDALGGPSSSVLAAGGVSPASRAGSVALAYGGSSLGAGAPASVGPAGGGYSGAGGIRTPSRLSAL